MQYMSFDGITFIFLDDNHWFFSIYWLSSGEQGEEKDHGYRKKLNLMHPMVGFQIGTSTNPNLAP